MKWELLNQPSDDYSRTQTRAANVPGGVALHVTSYHGSKPGEICTAIGFLPGMRVSESGDLEPLQPRGPFGTTGRLAEALQATAIDPRDTCRRCSNPDSWLTYPHTCKDVPK
jgi:hypothetical protein